MAELIDVNLPIFCGPIIKRDSSKACSLYFDLTLLPSPSHEIPKLKMIRFDNYFTSSLSISQPVAPPSSSSSSNINNDNNNKNGSNHTGSYDYGDHVTILENRTLMKDPASETEALSTFTIDVSEFNDKYEPKRMNVLRFTLFQPSTMWKTFDLRNIRALGEPLNAISASQKNDIDDTYNYSNNKSKGDSFHDEDIETLMMGDFRIICARSQRQSHNKLAIGSKLEGDAHSSSSRNKKKGKKLR